MAKAIIRLGYKEYVLDAEKAMRLVVSLMDAELYETKYDRGENGKTTTTYHVYPRTDATEQIETVQLMTDEFYRMAKLAGKPERNNG